MTKAVWYFDFVSPFSYLQLARFHKLPAGLELTLKPVVLSALLKHWGLKGPAEISTKRRFVYRFLAWQAHERGVPFTMPPVHPFNSLSALRLSLVKGADLDTVRRIFHFIFGEGRNLDEGESLLEIAEILGVSDVHARIADPSVKQKLRANTEEAIAAGAFGVPTFVANDEIFWGDDATAMFLDFLHGAPLFQHHDMKRISNMPMGLARST